MVEFKVGLVTITLDVTDAETPAKINYIGDDQEIVATVRSGLRSAYGMYGHLIGDSSTAIDVYHALLFNPLLKGLGAKVVKGQDIIDKWQPTKFPQGSVS